MSAIIAVRVTFGPAYASEFAVTVNEAACQVSWYAVSAAVTALHEKHGFVPYEE